MRKRELPSRNSETDAVDILPNPLRAAGRLRRNRPPEEPAVTAPKLMPHPATIVLPTHVRYARTPDKLRQMEAAIAAEAAIATEQPRGPQAGTTRVKFGRTPDHLIQQVWKGVLPALPPQQGPAEAPVGSEAPHAESRMPTTAAFIEEPLAAETLFAGTNEPAEREDVAFVAISDHAFFEFGCNPALLPAKPADRAVAGEQEAASAPEACAPQTHAGEDHEPEVHEADEPEPGERTAPAGVSADSVEAWWSHAYSVNLRLVGSTGIERAFTTAPTKTPEPAVEDSPAEEPTLPVAPEPQAPAVRVPEAPTTNAIAVPPGNDNRVVRREVARPPVAALKPPVAPAPAPARQPAPPPAAEAFELPPITLLAEPPVSTGTGDAPEFIEQNAALLESTLEDFGVKGEIINAHPGPVVTLYELEPAPGTKSSRVISLADDIARSMSAVSARVAVVPGRNAIGIELPNARRETVYLRELLASQDFEQTRLKLALCLGKTIGGEPVIAELARMPHLLVAGTTGSGKSVAINTMILSLLYRLRPEECRLIMVDPKMLELSIYDGIPHLLTPVVTDPKKAVVALKWAVREMEERYKKMSKLGVRNIDGFNARIAEARAKGEVITRTVQTGFDRETGEAVYEDEVMDLAPLPYIVVIVDEMADLMMVAGKEIEGTIQRLAQMARAAGIHVVLATQRPSVDVITGTIKANFPTRISFQVTSKIDSRTILGEQGAEQLLGQGDMLYMAGGGRITRVHGPFVSDEEVEKVVAHLKAQGRPQY
ncbi:FtsK/SpoIIIE family, partial [Chelatococcus sambhunathii]